MITTTKAVQIAADWHSGQFSALYQFCSSSCFVFDNYERYLNEIDEILKSEQKKWHRSNLNDLREYLEDYYKTAKSHFDKLNS